MTQKVLLFRLNNIDTKFPILNKKIKQMNPQNISKTLNDETVEPSFKRLIKKLIINGEITTISKFLIRYLYIGLFVSRKII